MHVRTIFLSTLLLTSLACGGSVYQPSRVAHFDPDGAAEVDDEDVRKAFEAKSQMGDAINVAFFSFDPGKDADIEKAIRAVSGVSTVYSIPALAVTGQHRFEETPSWQAPAAAPLGVKKLRLLAARAHCDVLVVVDYSRRTDVTVNGFAAFNVLILPALFLPFRDVKVESAVDAFVIDTRNGYMYGHVALSKEARAPRETIYADDDALVASEWTALQGELEGALVKLVDAERKHPAAVAHP